MSNQLIYLRKAKLEAWLKALNKRKLVFETLSSFLETKTFDERADLTPDELIVRDFSESLLLNPQRKVAWLDKFMKEFFVRRRVISYDIAEGLFQVLIPLCADSTCFGKPLDIICKLLDRDFYRFFDFMQKVFTQLPICLLKKMNLKDYLNKKISPDSQAKAFVLLKILSESDRAIEDLLEADQQALEVFKNWGTCIEETRFRKSSKSEMISVIHSKDLSISYKTRDKVIQVSGYFEVNSSPEKLVELFTSPFERKEWDLKLVNIFEDAPGFKIYYEIDGKVKEFDVEMNVEQFDSSACIKVHAKMTSCPCSDFFTVFSVERVQSNDSQIELMTGKVRCSWNSEFKGKSGRLVMFDLIGEDTLMVNSFKILMELAQSRDRSYSSKNKRLSIHEAVQRKNLSFLHK
jgi:hypothetical protein